LAFSLFDIYKVEHVLSVSFKRSLFCTPGFLVQQRHSKRRRNTATGAEHRGGDTAGAAGDPRKSI
jgi:hypothetical protein